MQRSKRCRSLKIKHLCKRLAAEAAVQAHRGVSCGAPLARLVHNARRRLLSAGAGFPGRNAPASLKLNLERRSRRADRGSPGRNAPASPAAWGNLDQLAKAKAAAGLRLTPMRSPRSAAHRTDRGESQAQQRSGAWRRDVGDRVHRVREELDSLIGVREDALPEAEEQAAPVVA